MSNYGFALSTFVIALLVRLLVVCVVPPDQILEFSFTDARSTPSSWLEELQDATARESELRSHRSVPNEIINLIPTSIIKLGITHSSLLIAIVDAVNAAAVGSWRPHSPHFALTHQANRCFVVPRWFWLVPALNPVSVIACYLSSSAPLEHLLIIALLSILRMKGSSFFLGRFVAAFVCLLLGIDFVAVLIPFFFPFHEMNERRAVVSSCLLYFGCSITVAAASLYVAPEVNAFLNTSPDIGPSWYVWQLMVPTFDKPYRLVMTLIPTVLTIPVALRSVSRIEKSCHRNRIVIGSWAVCASYVCRRTFSLPDLGLMMYVCALGTPEIVEQMKHFFTPLVGMCFCLPLQHAFYRGWVMTRVANANWLFFGCVFQMAAVVLFLLTYLGSFFLINDTDDGMRAK